MASYSSVRSPILCTNLVHIPKVTPYPVWILLYYRDNKLML